MRNALTLATALTIGLAVSAAAARADEEKVPLDKVPAAVMKAVMARFPGAAVKSAGKEEEDGKTVYELDLTHNGKAIEVSTKPDGTIVSVETVIKESDLPAAVSGALKARYPKAAVKKVEKVEEGGKVSYEVVVEKAPGKQVEVTLDETGKILEEEEAGKD